MPADDKQRQLVRWLERRAWNPILRASPDDYAEADRKRLQRVQRKTEAQRERYRGYQSAGQLRQEFQDDLHSQAAKSTNADLRKLDLPTQRDVADDFLKTADRLGVTAERGTRRPHHPHPPHPWHKSTPEKREQAKRKLKAQARKGDEQVLETLRTAPRKWARDYAEQLDKRGTGHEAGSTSRKKKKSAG